MSLQVALKKAKRAGLWLGLLSTVMLLWVELRGDRRADS